MIIEGLMMALIIILAIKLWSCETRLDLINEEVEDWIADARDLKQRCDGHKKSLEYLSKSVRELNGVVEAAVKVKEQTSDNKPDTKALIGGWSTDEGQARIDVSHIRTGMIDGESLMNCELPNLSESAREKIFELLGVKVPENEKPANATHISVGLIDGQSLLVPVRDTGQTLVDGETICHGRLWTNSEGRIYELPEGCYISGDTSYEMDQ